MPSPEGCLSIRLIVPASVPSFREGHIYVCLLDVTELDVAAPILGAAEALNASHTSGTPSSFELELRLPTETAPSMAVRAHIDLDDDGEVSAGDVISKTACPWRRVEVPVLELELECV